MDDNIILRLEEVEREMAQRTAGQHFLQALLGIFNFEFFSVLSELKWTQERICKSGDYEPKLGRFYRKGYLKE